MGIRRHKARAPVCGGRTEVNLVPSPSGAVNSDKIQPLEHVDIPMLFRFGSLPATRETAYAG